MSLSGSGGPAPETAPQPASGAGFTRAATNDPIATSSPFGGSGTPPSAPIAPAGPISTTPIPVTPWPTLNTTTGALDPKTLVNRVPSSDSPPPAANTPRANPGAGAMQLAGQNSQDMLAAVSRGGFAPPRAMMGAGYAGPLSASGLQAKTQQLLSNPQVQSFLKTFTGGM